MAWRGPALLLTCALLLAACGARAPLLPPEADTMRPVSAQAATDVGPIIDRLEAGELAEAERLLEALLAQRPDHSLARRYLEQLRGDPFALFGRAYEEIEVGVGESLSVIAQREFGDPHLFLALARYNDIRVPRRLVAGQRLRIPSALRPSTSIGPGADAEVIELDAVDREVAASEALPAQSSITHVEQEQSLRAQTLVAQAHAQLAAGQSQLALAALDEAAGLDPEQTEARDQARELRGQLVADGHESALTRFRDQDLAAAIALWDEVLLLDPEFTPAQVYRARALALLERLRAMDE